MNVKNLMTSETRTCTPATNLAEAAALMLDADCGILPVVDKEGRPWLLDGKPVYCLRGTQYETVNDERVHLARCPDCGGMGIRADEFVVESDCIHCTACGHEFDARLEMMET